jgi:hypothetical protein
LNHISPFLSENTQNTEQNSNGSFECKVWRNSFNLFRGSEYQRFFWATSQEPLTYYGKFSLPKFSQNFKLLNHVIII